MGRTCILCGRERANEKFGGKGFRRGACVDCRRLPKVEQERRLAWDEIEGFLHQGNISEKNIARLGKLTHIADPEFQTFRALLVEVAKIAPRKRRRWRHVKAANIDLFKRCFKVSFFGLDEFDDESDEGFEPCGFDEYSDAVIEDGIATDLEACEPICFVEIGELFRDRICEGPSDKDADDSSSDWSTRESPKWFDDPPDGESVPMPDDAPVLMTLEEFVQRPIAIYGSQEELVAGVVVSRPQPSFRHWLAQANVGSVLIAHVRAMQLGQVAFRTGIVTRRNPDTVRGPAVAYWSFERLPIDVEVEVYPDVAADLCVEVLSPDDRPRDVQQKIREYFECCVRMVWVVDPEARSVTIYRTAQEGRLLWDDAMISGEDVLPGFACSVNELFE